MDDAGELFGGPGTWDELVLMRSYRELSSDEYMTILRAKEAWSDEQKANDGAHSTNLKVSSVSYFSAPNPDDPMSWFVSGGQMLTTS